jgi:RNA polymerase sigma-70 factor (ECF subfamily)
MDHATRSPRHTARRTPDPQSVALLRQAQTGDRDAFGTLYQLHVDTVRRYVAARMRDRDRDAVPDLVQDTFAAALEELDAAHHDVVGWMIGLAAKVCTRHGWRQRSHLRAVLTLGEHQRSLAATAPEVPHLGRQLVAQALAGLDPQQRLTVQLRFLDGQPQQTTADIMDCSRWTVRRREQQALVFLAAALTDARRQQTRTR